ncbi:polysaccharide biosynthesis protein [gamma proteobacterium NOR5-3]|nr:polysaccharide biosynthesis protein [gamma proteobacterium NOR5-3]
MSLLGQAFSSSLLLVGIKAVQRSLGLVTLLILARLLTPEDFGLVALVSIVVHFFDIMSSAGGEQYIIQKPSVTPDELNTAWTIDLLMKAALWVVLMLLASPLAVFFERPELATGLWLASSVLLVNACANPGLFLLKRSLHYQGIFWLSVVQRFTTFVVVIILAYQWQSFWVIIIGDVVSSLVFTVGSFLIHRHRPRLSKTHWTEQWSFSGWMLLRGIVGYARSALDTLFVSKLFSPASLGQYSMARDVAMLPAHNVVMPGTEPLLAVFGRARDSQSLLSNRVELSLKLVALVVVPLTTLLFVFSEGITALLLGPQWTEADQLLKVLTLLLFYFSFVSVYEKALIATANTRRLFAVEAFSLLIIFVGLLVMRNSPLLELATARGLLGCLNLLIIAWVCRQILGVPFLSLFRALLLPIVLSSAAVVTVGISQTFTSALATDIVFVMDVLVYGASYATLFALFVWIGAGDALVVVREHLVSKLKSTKGL